MNKDMTKNAQQKAFSNAMHEFLSFIGMADSDEIINKACGIDAASFFLEKQKQKEAFLSCAEQLISEDGQQKGANQGTENIRALIDAFVDNKLWMHSLNLQYYPNRASSIAKDAEDAFLASWKTLKGLAATGRQQGYMADHAVLWCEVKENIACRINSKTTYFDINKLSKRCMDAHDKYTKAPSFLMLNGLCNSMASYSLIDAVAAFMQIINETSSKSLIADANYQLGKIYDKYGDKKEEAKQSYLLANKASEQMGGNNLMWIRSAFRLALCDKRRKAFTPAMKRFDAISEKLEPDERDALLTPLEIEFLFDTYIHQLFICNKRCDYDNVIRYGKKCEEIYDTVIDESQYFDALYGAGNTDKYRELTKERLNILMALLAICDAYKQLHDKSGAASYQEKARQYEKRYME